MQSKQLDYSSKSHNDCSASHGMKQNGTQQNRIEQNGTELNGIEWNRTKKWNETE